MIQGVKKFSGDVHLPNIPKTLVKLDGGGCPLVEHLDHKSVGHRLVGWVSSLK